MTAQHYLNLLRTQQAAYVEGVLQASLAETSRLNGASALSHQLVAESMAGAVELGFIVLADDVAHEVGVQTDTPGSRQSRDRN
jgi:hypothetical protein